MHPLDIHWIYSFGSVALVAGASFMGMVGLALSPHRLGRVVPLLVSLAAGALLGTAFGHLLPECVEQIGTGRKLSALLLFGFVIFFALEKILHVWCNGHSEHPEGPHHHEALHSFKKPPASGAAPVVTNILFGAGIHSFIDGMAIATGYSTNTHLGLVTTIAVLLHEAPHHIGDVSILIHKGVPVRRAVILNLMAGSAAAAGALLVLLIGTRSADVTLVLLPLTAANFIYIATANLMPELQHERRVRQSFTQTILFVAGCLLLFVFSGVSEPG
jgi:zinc and cadmium transporter